MGRKKLEIIESCKFSFKGSREMKLYFGEKRKGYGITRVLFWMDYITGITQFRGGDDVGGKRGYYFCSHVLEKGWDPVNRRRWW